MQETGVQSQDWEDPLEEDMATHSSILAWEIPWTEEPGVIQHGSQTLSKWTSPKQPLICLLSVDLPVLDIS